MTMNRLCLIACFMVLPMVSSSVWQGASFAPDSLKTTAHRQRAFMHGLHITDDRLQDLKIDLAALDIPPSNINCFSRTTASMHSKCADIDTNQDARVDGIFLSVILPNSGTALIHKKAAISMTLCEIATAMHHSVPRECLSYSSERKILPEIRSQSRGECVDALARSVQYWATYSGYLREIPQLCYAYTRWNDIDMARDLYRNITIEKVSFIKFLFEHETEQRQLSSHFEVHLLDMQELASRLFKKMDNQDTRLDDSIFKVNQAVVEVHRTM
ncbi:hypothetical protein BJ165DRAFT_1487649 [Panaeolus papilionaceus]|nr:hypothetical protein BJ165DRAFT_1487649 [Panaeolus papilionaceus]